MLHGANAGFLDEKFQRWLEDPDQVEPEWRQLFEEVGAEGLSPRAVQPPGADTRSIFGGTGRASAEDVARVAHRQAGAVQYINAMRVRGHFQAHIDPLGRRIKRQHPELTFEHYGLGESDLDSLVLTAPVFGMPPEATLREIREHLQAAYCGSIGAEFMNIDNREQKLWVLEQLEKLPAREVLSREGEHRVLRKLSDAENFERMLHQRFPGTKRFSLEGGETLIPLLDLLITEAGKAGVREIVMGMAHRGRLNVLTNVLEKPARLIVEEFQDVRGPAHGSGDVKYHVGYSSNLVTDDGHDIHLSLTPNPSHLEVVNSVVQGRTRAKQDRAGDHERLRSLSVLLHGDAAFIGQGSVAETLQLSELAGYQTGGTIHIIVNNQIGFTTAPQESRSTPYATDVARMLAIPILHVNGEDPRAVGAVVQIAMQWRQRFKRDVIIDMYCYRKHGHNEGDEPSFTQPRMYEVIRKRPTPREAYANWLVEKGYTTTQDVERIWQESELFMRHQSGIPDVDDGPVVPPENVEEEKGEDPDQSFYVSSGARSVVNKASDTGESVSAMKGTWEALTDGQIDEEVSTSVELERLTSLMTRANTLPEGFNAHRKVTRVVEQRLAAARGERALDWAVAEQAAFASLVTEGYSVRLSGQDSARGTFSQRHAVWTDTLTGEEIFSLSHLADDQRPFGVIDSNLSEFAVLAFEFGFSLDTPDGLILWEAQFGDFANGAQVVVDQFISSSEQKWGRLSGLVMLLPHAYEGQGPEHSSARLERYLMQCAQANMQVANCTTPANYFHILRRQVVRHVRKPLILMTPKSLLRHPSCTSTLEDLTEGEFQHVIADPRAIDAAAVKRVVFCSGHVYYDLIAAYADYPDASSIVVHRVEMLYPYPQDVISSLIDAAPPEAELMWTQEEPENMGAWPLLSHWMRAHLPHERVVRVVARPSSASPATGSHSVHRREQDAIISATLTL
jgi:2-oxoglutarate dehydrogenase E1 component